MGGACRAHRDMDCGCKSITIGKLAKVVDRLLDSGVTQKDLPLKVGEEFFYLFDDVDVDDVGECLVEADEGQEGAING